MRDYTNIMDEDTRLREAAGKATSAQAKVKAPASAPASASSSTREEGGSSGLAISGILLVVFGLGVAYTVLKPTRKTKSKGVAEGDKEQK